MKCNKAANVQLVNLPLSFPLSTSWPELQLWLSFILLLFLVFLPLQTQSSSACEQQKISLKVFLISWLRKA